MKNHYVYEIYNQFSGMKYIGARSCNCKPKKDLGHYYFSSSSNKNFMKEQKKYPDSFSYIIRKEFKTRQEAMDYEIVLHKELDVANSKNFYNKVRARSAVYYEIGKAFEKKRKLEEESRIKKASKIIRRRKNQKIIKGNKNENLPANY